ncbi:hypothetical protein G9A89_004517 [Geosiphon pyriformis]|nr:hypothetical protein G9A89_004517 [Geosiphon pyriformis]
MIGKSISKPQSLVLNSESSIKLHTVSILTSLCTNDAAINLSTTSVIYQLQPPTIYQPQTIQIPSQNLLDRSRQWNSGASHPQNPNFQDYLSLLVTPEDASPSNQESTQKQQTLTSNIPPATVTNNKLLAAIFPFEIKEPSSTPLFSGAALDEKPITAMYTDAKVDSQFIKLILNSGSAGSCQVDQTASTRIITANGATKIPIGKIDDFSFEVNSIMTPIKVLVKEATQYQALVGNDWLSKVNATLDWNTQELQLTYQGQDIHVLATCGHFKTPPREKLLIKLEEEKEKPTWKAYQEEPSSWEWKKEKRKGKEREEENTQANNTYIPYTYSQQQSSTYHRSKLICIDCSKKLLSMGACCGDDEEYQMAPKFYCHACPCGETFFDEGMWNNIPGRGKTCDVSCQYMILINDWVKKETPIEATWRRAI